MTLSKFSEYEKIRIKNDVVTITYRQISLKITLSLALLETNVLELLP